MQTNVAGNEKMKASCTPIPMGPDPGVGPGAYRKKPAKNEPARNTAPLLRKNFSNRTFSFKVNTIYEMTKPTDKYNGKSTKNPGKTIIFLGIGGN